MGFKGKNDIFNCSSSSHWVDIMKKKGLVLVDIYTMWAGPCEIMLPFIMKIKSQIQELTQMLLHYLSTI